MNSNLFLFLFLFLYPLLSFSQIHQHVWSQSNGDAQNTRQFSSAGPKDCRILFKTIPWPVGSQYSYLTPPSMPVVDFLGNILLCRQILTLTPSHSVLANIMYVWKLDGLTGKLLWTTQLNTVSPGQPSASLALGPVDPVTLLYSVFVNGIGSLFSLNSADGEILWSLPLNCSTGKDSSGTTRLNQGATSSISVSPTDGSVFVSFNGPRVLPLSSSFYTVYAWLVNGTTGKLRWQVVLGSSQQSPLPGGLTVDGKQWVVGFNSGPLVSMTARNGAVYWSETSVTNAPVMTSDGTIYVGGYDTMALYQNGDVQWMQNNLQKPRTMFAMLNNAQETSLYVVRTTTIAKLRGDNGTILWNVPFTKKIYPAYPNQRWEYLYPVVDAQGTCYYGSNVWQTINALSSFDGSLLWSYNLTSHITTPLSFGVNGSLILPTLEGVYVFGNHQGTPCG